MEYSVANFFDNVWLNIEDYGNPLYWVKVKSSLYVRLLNNRVQNQLILYLKGRVSTRNLSINILKLKEPWTDLFLNSELIIYKSMPR